MKSMTYGQMPTRAEFRSAFNREIGVGALYDIKFGMSDARMVSRVTGERTSWGQTHRFREAELWLLCRTLLKAYDKGDDEAGDFVSSVLTTLGFEWI